MEIKTEDISLPGLIKSVKGKENYKVRYLKVNLDDPGSLAELEIIETRGLQGDEIVLLGKEKYNFMDKYYIVLQYLEKIINE
jgi:hypothetical protein